MRALFIIKDYFEDFVTTLILTVRQKVVLQRQPHPSPPQSWGGRFGPIAHLRIERISASSASSYRVHLCIERIFVSSASSYRAHLRIERIFASSASSYRAHLCIERISVSSASPYRAHLCISTRMNVPALPFSPKIGGDSEGVENLTAYTPSDFLPHRQYLHQTQSITRRPPHVLFLEDNFIPKRRLLFQKIDYDLILSG